MDNKLTMKTKVGFGICDVGGNLFFTVMAFQLASYLTDTVGMTAVLMGISMMIGRIVDAVTDPLMGFISDRTRSRWGRRRPYLLFGAIPLFICMVLMFTNPHMESQGSLFVWITLIFCLLSVAYTVVNIPYGALTPELTKDFHQRTVLNGYRMSFAVVGTLLGAGAALPIIQSAADESAGYRLMGIIFGGIMMVTALITFFTVKEPAQPAAQKHEKRFLLKEYVTAFRNKPFLLILIPWALFITGVTITSSSLKYYFEYVVLDANGVTMALLVLLVFALLGIPVWVKISKRIGKRLSYMTGMTIFSAGILLLSFLGDRVSVTGLYCIMALTGAGLSTHYIIPYALIPDVIEWDYAHTGQRREGIYYGLWTFISKLGQALSGLIIGITLSASGYVANTMQGAASVSAIRFLTGAIPTVVIIAGILVIRNYPISEEVYREIILKSEKLDRADETV